MSATPTSCAGCAREIPEDRVHYLLDTAKVVCGHCVAQPRSHTRLAPGCPSWQHQANGLLAHVVATGDQATIRQHNRQGARP